MTQVAKIKNTYYVYLTKDKMNPYTVMRKWLSPDVYGLREHVRTLEKFADLKSCLLYIADRIEE